MLKTAILFHILFIQIFSNYVILPFDSKKLNSSSFASKTSLFSLLSVGQPKKTVEMFLVLWQSNFNIRKGLCQLNSYSDYLPEKSTTFKNYTNEKNVTITTDNIFLYANDLDLKNNITLKDIQFNYKAYSPDAIDKEKVCGNIGLNSDYSSNEGNFINILKQKNITSTYTFSFIFFNSFTKNTIFSKSNRNDNFLIIGMSEAEISKEFNTNDLRSVEVKIEYPYFAWCLQFDEIFLNNTNKNINKKLIGSNTVYFANEYEFIMMPKANFNTISDYFFKEYIEKNICKLNNETENLSQYYYISCDESFKAEMSKFPDINFMIRDINYTFSLTYEDLFIELNQKIYFMLVYETRQMYYWSFGNIFLKKYPLIFDHDKKTITLINIYNDNNDDKKFKFTIVHLLFFIGGICVILGIFFGIIIGKNICNKNKKKRANELSDDYEYNIKEDNNEQKLFENNNIIND